jgi:hypothetical protein
MYHRGCFGYNTSYNLSAITDGTSNTLIFSEKEGVSDLVVSRKVKTDLVLTDFGDGVFIVAGPVGALGSRSVCQNFVGRGGEYGPGIIDSNLRAWPGKLFDGSPFFNSFWTITPPNGPSCFVSTYQPNSGHMITASSRHPGGVSAAFGDGAIRFVSEMINVGTGDAFSNPPEANGHSPFGVWGALGSRNGGETASLP